MFTDVKLIVFTMFFATVTSTPAVLSLLPFLLFSRCSTVCLDMCFLAVIFLAIPDNTMFQLVVTC